MPRHPPTVHLAELPAFILAKPRHRRRQGRQILHAAQDRDFLAGRKVAGGG
jgi:hypothetical protein